MSRTWFSRRGLTCDSETFSIKTHTNADADLNGNRLLTTLDLVPGLSLAPIGSTPNANGASVASGVLSFQPANASFGGVATNGAQTFAGVKNFSNGLQLSNGSTVLDTYTHTTGTCRFRINGSPALTAFTIDGVVGDPNAVPVDVYRTGTTVIITIPGLLAQIADPNPDNEVNSFGLDHFAPPLPTLFPSTQPCLMATDDFDVYQLGSVNIQNSAGGFMSFSIQSINNIYMGNFRAFTYINVVIP